MQVSNPLVTVLMTSYNRQAFIAEAIESVLQSTYQNFELIIVDDCSNDKTVDIAKSYALKDKRIRLYVNKTNLGDYANRNCAALYASGAYIMYVDSDDKTYPDSIEYCIDQMLYDPKADIGILCRIPELCGATLAPYQSIPYHFFQQPFLTMGPGGTIIKKSFFQSINYYPDKYGPANDMYFNLKAAAGGYIRCLCKEFLYYRIHEGQEQNNAFSYLYNNYLYLRDAFDEVPLPLTIQQLRLLKKKNKRRLIVNLFNFFYKTKDIGSTRTVIQKTGFTLTDALQGIFH